MYIESFFKCNTERALSHKETRGKQSYCKTYRMLDAAYFLREGISMFMKILIANRGDIAAYIISNIVNDWTIGQSNRRI